MAVMYVVMYMTLNSAELQKSHLQLCWNHSFLECRKIIKLGKTICFLEQ